METVKDIATILGFTIAIVTVFLGILEYRRQGAAKRAEHFLETRRRLKENESFKAIAELIEDDDINLCKIPFRDKRDYLGLFEEVAMAMNSGLIRKKVAFYMFGYYAIRCWRSSNFWNDVNRDSIYWTLFRDFVDQMVQVEKGFQYRRRDFIL